MAAVKKVSNQRTRSNSGESIMGSVITLQTFEKLVQLQAQTTINMSAMADCLKESVTVSRQNTAAVSELVKSMAPVIPHIASNRRLMRQVLYGFLPIIVALLTVILTLVLRHTGV